MQIDGERPHALVAVWLKQFNANVDFERLPVYRANPVIPLD